MLLLKALAATLAVVFTALAMALTVVIIVWLAGQYNVDRLLQIAGVVATIAGILLSIILYYRQRR